MHIYPVPVQTHLSGTGTFIRYKLQIWADWLVPFNGIILVPFVIHYILSNMHRTISPFLFIIIFLPFTQQTQRWKDISYLTNFVQTVLMLIGCLVSNISFVVLEIFIGAVNRLVRYHHELIWINFKVKWLKMFEFLLVLDENCFHVEKILVTVICALHICQIVKTLIRKIFILFQSKLELTISIGLKQNF